MKRAYLVLLNFLVLLDAQAALPSQSVVYSCLAAQSVHPSVRWRNASKREINSEDDYKDGYKATFYIVVDGKELGYAEKGESKAILYDHNIYPTKLAQALPGFKERPTELDPFAAEWGTLTDAGGSYLCISFPFGVLGQSGSFQSNRSAFLMTVNGKYRWRILWSATGNIASFLANAVPLPKDIRAFVKKRDSCEYFRGEAPDPSEKQHMKELARQITVFCKGSDKTLASLKRKYASNPMMMSRLDEYENDIEANSDPHR